jgi:hypothetical protein
MILIGLFLEIVLKLTHVQTVFAVFFFSTLFPFSLFSFILQGIHFLLLISRQGKTRLTKWYEPYATKDKTRIVREVTNLILNRSPKLCNFLEWKEFKVISRRYDESPPPKVHEEWLCFRVDLH